MISRSVPLRFILERHRLTLNETVLGLREGWLDAADIMQHSAQLSFPDTACLFTGTQTTIEIANSFTRQFSSTSEESTKASTTWLRILLSWIYENRDKIDNPLDLVEQIYADFDYPDEIHHLIRFNPPQNGYRPQDHSPEENTARLMRLWKEYCAMHMEPGNSSEG